MSREKHMAEEILIGGYTKEAIQALPEWAKDSTLKTLLKQAEVQSSTHKAAVEFLSRIATGQRVTRSDAKSMLDALDKVQKQILEDTKTTTKSNDDLGDKVDDLNKETKKSSLGTFNKLSMLVGEITGLREDLEKEAKRAASDRADMISAFERQGVSADDAEGMADTIAMVASYAGPLGKALTIIGGTITAAEAFNQFMLTQIDDRFNLVNEIRQSGMFSAFSETTHNLQSFSQAVADNTFSLAMAADMAQKFSGAVGVYGVENAMNFVRSLRDEGEYIERFGANFGQIINFAGDFLEIQKNLGQLQDMDDNRRNRGMEGFMQTVMATSSALKISMEEAAALIRDSFADQDLRVLTDALMAGASDEQRIAALGAREQLGGQLGEALSIMMMDPQAFFSTPEAQALLADPTGQQTVDLLMTMANDIRAQGGDQEAVSRVLEANQDRFREITQNMGTRELAIVGEGRAIYAELMNAVTGRLEGMGERTQEQVDPVDAANAAFQETRRQNDLAIEAGMTRVIRQYDDLAGTLRGQAAATAGLNVQLQQTFETYGSALAEASELALWARQEALELSAAALDLINGDGQIEGFTTAAQVMNTAAATQHAAAINFRNAVDLMLDGTWTGDGLEGGTASQQQYMATALVEQMQSDSSALQDIQVTASDVDAQIASANQNLSDIGYGEFAVTMTPEELQDAANVRNERANAQYAELLQDMGSLALQFSEGNFTADDMEQFLSDEGVFAGSYSPEIIAGAINDAMVAATNQMADGTQILNNDQAESLVRMMTETMREQDRDLVWRWGEDGQQQLERTMQMINAQTETNELLRQLLGISNGIRSNTGNLE